MPDTVSIDTDDGRVFQVNKKVAQDTINNLFATVDSLKRLGLSKAEAKERIVMAIDLAWD